MKKQNKEQGFTLVELLVVIAILAILATVSIVGYTAFIERANKSNALASCRSELTELEGLYAMRGEMVPDGLILGDKKGEFFFEVKDGILEETEAPAASAKKTELQVCDLYSTEEIGSISFGAAREWPNGGYWTDCVNFQTEGLSGTLTVTVWDDNGNVIYQETGKDPIDGVSVISFDIYGEYVNGNNTHGGNDKWLTSAAPKTGEQAYGRYYTYSLATETKTISGVFFYAEPAEPAQLIPAK